VYPRDRHSAKVDGEEFNSDEETDSDQELEPGLAREREADSETRAALIDTFSASPD
jgi:hypothetical protein